MAVKRRAGDFFSGFADAFLPMYQFMQENKRADERLQLQKEGAERQERRDVMGDAASQGQSLANRWATDQQFEAKVQSLAALHPEIPIEDIRSSVMSDMPSRTQRRSAGQDRTTAWTDPETYQSILKGVGMPEHLLESLPGKVPTAEQPAPFLDPNLGLLAGQQTEYPFKATPAGDITRALADAPGTFEGSREGQLFSELQAGRQGALKREFEDRSEWERKQAELLQRQQAGIAEELTAQYHPAALQRLVTEFNEMSPLQNEQRLEQYEAEVAERFKDDERRANNPEYQEALRQIALRTHLITNEPEPIPLLDPVTNTVSWMVLNKITDPNDPRHGQSVLQTPGEAFGAEIAANFLEGKIPFSPFLFESLNDPWTKLILSNFTAVELENTLAVGTQLAEEHAGIETPEQGQELVETALQSQGGPVPTVTTTDEEEPDVPDVVLGGSDAASEIFGDDAEVTPVSADSGVAQIHRIKADQNQQALSIATVILIPELKKELAGIEQQLSNMPPDLRDSPEFKARNDLYNRKFQEIQEMEDAIESGQATDSMLRQTRPGLGIGTNPARRTQTR
jgi:hypothetical protein